jgi:hypothetical protein
VAFVSSAVTFAPCTLTGMAGTVVRGAEAAVHGTAVAVHAIAVVVHAIAVAVHAIAVVVHATAVVVHASILRRFGTFARLRAIAVAVRGVIRIANLNLAKAWSLRKVVEGRRSPVRGGETLGVE